MEPQRHGERRDVAPTISSAISAPLWFKIEAEGASKKSCQEPYCGASLGSALNGRLAEDFRSQIVQPATNNAPNTFFCQKLIAVCAS